MVVVLVVVFFGWIFWLVVWVFGCLSILVGSFCLTCLPPLVLPALVLIPPLGGGSTVESGAPVLYPPTRGCGSTVEHDKGRDGVAGWIGGCLVLVFCGRLWVGLATWLVGVWGFWS